MENAKLIMIAIAAVMIGVQGSMAIYKQRQRKKWAPLIAEMEEIERKLREKEKSPPDA